MDIDLVLAKKILSELPVSYMSVINRDLTVGFTTGQEFRELGLNPIEFVGKTVEEVFGEHAPEVRKHYVRCFDGNPCQFELFINNQYQRYNVVPLYESDGSINNILSVVENISALKDYQMQVEAREALVNRMSSIARIGGWEIDLSANKISFTKGVYDILDLEYDEEPPGIEEHLAQYMPGDQEHVKKALDDLIQNGTTQDFVAALKTYKGNIRHIRAIGQRRVKENQGVMLYGIFQDVTEKFLADKLQKEAEIRFVKYFEHAPVGVFLANEKGEYIDVNPAASKITGYPVEELKTMLVPDVIPKANQDFAYNHFKQVREKGHAKGESPFLRKDGSIGYWIIEALKLSEGQFLGFVTDISKRREAEMLLKESEEKYRLLFEKSTDPILMLDGMVFSECNDATIQFLNYKSRDQVIGKSPWEISPKMQPDGQNSKTKAQNIIHKVEKEGYHRFEWVHLTSNAEERHLDITLTRIVEKGIMRLYTVWRDVTPRIVAQKKSIEIQTRFQELFDTINSGVAIYKVMNDGKMGKDYIIQDFNRTALELEGMTKAEVVGKSLFDLRPNIDDYGLIDIFRKVWKTGNPAFYPAKIYTDEKYANYYENRVFRLPSGEIVAVYDDVTRQKKAEEELRYSENRYRSVYEEAPLAFCVWTPDNKLTEWNEQAEKIFGYTKDEAVGKSFFDLIIPENAHGVVHEIVKDVLSGKVQQNVVNQNITKEGKMIWCQWTNAAIRNETGDIKYIISMAKDVTEQKEAEEQLEKYRNHLEELVRERTKELEHKNAELERFNNLFVGREFRIKELRDEVKELKKQIQELKDNNKGF